MSAIPFFLLLSSIHLYGYVAFWLSSWWTCAFFHFSVTVNNVYKEYYRNCVKYYTLCHILDDCEVVYKLLFSLRKNNDDLAASKQPSDLTLLFLQWNIPLLPGKPIIKEVRLHKQGAEVLSESCLPHSRFCCSCCFVLLFVFGEDHCIYSGIFQKKVLSWLLSEAWSWKSNAIVGE